MLGFCDIPKKWSTVNKKTSAQSAVSRMVLYIKNIYKTPDTLRTLNKIDSIYDSKNYPHLSCWWLIIKIKKYKKKDVGTKNGDEERNPRCLNHQASAVKGNMFNDIKNKY